MGKEIILSPEQSEASSPAINVVVQANAGTGKTFVLVRRLLRILFREFQARTEGAGKTGAARPGILCLTYTKAGASEMRNRVLGSVLEWASASDGDLRGLLSGIAHNNPPDDRDLQTARKIFYDFIDNPHLLKIQTVHSFCEDILRRFPIEAAAPPAWRLVSGAEQKRLLKDAFAELLNRARPDEEEAFGHIIGLTSEYSLDALLDSILEQYRDMILLKQKSNFPDYLVEKTKGFLSLNNPPPKPDFDGDIDLVLTKTGDIRKKLPPELQKVAPGVYARDQYEKNMEIMRISSDFLTLCGGFADKYAELKNRRGLLDFDDILYKTMILFSNPETMGQVLSQLDMSLRHILVDESQDNSPVMWRIIFSMLDDFFADGDGPNPRSLFMVGDVKQSIFSFQGASPSEFASIPEKIRRAAAGGMRQYETVPLLESRRATQAILDVADYFFNAAGLPGFPKNVAHKCWRKGDAGLVEINPICSRNAGEELASARKRYIRIIAGKIESMAKKENIPQSDIMVLVQRRDPFVPMLVRELKRKGIQTAGSD
ncbi:MAG: UvrD-helicase domain-containing protein, partial [Rickettsiales bacterium]|nr:UvrD-helicase domain-containing protein [Rickettsiales bacterium]